MSDTYGYRVSIEGRSGGRQYFTYAAALRAAREWRDDTNQHCTIYEIDTDGSQTPVAEVRPMRIRHAD